MGRLRGERDSLDRSRLDIHTDGSTLVIEANQSDYSWLGWSRRNRIVETDFDIKVPRKINLDINVFSSPVTVTGVEGSHRLHGFSSKLQIEDVTGSVQDGKVMDALQALADGGLLASMPKPRRPGQHDPV